MKHSNITKIIFTILALIIFNSIVMIFVFSIWELQNTDLFVWGLITVLIALLFTNLIILFSNKILKLFGVPAYTSATIITLVYFLFVFIFTWLSYENVTLLWYLILVLLINLIYIVIISRLYVSGVNKHIDTQRQEEEKEKVLNVTLELTKLESTINSCKNTISEDDYKQFVNAFNSLQERLKMSTPFGRTTKTVVSEMEAKILTQITLVNDSIIQSLKEPDANVPIESFIERLSEIRVMVINREKLNV